MAQLHIKRLTCANRQDSVGRDETRIQQQLVGGGATVISGPYSLGQGDFVPLDELVPFNAAITVQLVEVDLGPDDTLGTAVINANLVGTGDHTDTFSALANAEYELTYDVHP
jgi:hypothetical protein